jgi:hypothetical protein
MSEGIGTISPPVTFEEFLDITGRLELDEPWDEPSPGDAPLIVIDLGALPSEYLEACVEPPDLALPDPDAEILDSITTTPETTADWQPPPWAYKLGAAVLAVTTIVPAAVMAIGSDGASLDSPHGAAPAATPSTRPPTSRQNPSPDTCRTVPPGSTSWSRVSLQGHRLPALQGGAGLEEAIDAKGRVGSTGHPVAHARYLTSGRLDPSLEYLVRRFYIAMRWDDATVNWLGGTHKVSDESVNWYKNAPSGPRMVLVVAPTGESVVVAAMDWGPAPWAGTPGGRQDRQQRELWERASGGDGYMTGTPAGYKGRVAGLSPAAAQAIGFKQWMFGGPKNGGSGHSLLYAWAPDQMGAPGKPTGLNAAAAAELRKHPTLTSIKRIKLLCDAVFPTTVSLKNINTGPQPEIPTNPPRRCSGEVLKGTRALGRFAFAQWRGRNSGMYSCRPIEGTNRLSLHGTGRAVDVGLLASRPSEKKRGDQLFAWLIKNSGNIGLQEAIWNGWIWTPDKGLQKHTGKNPHTNHVHFALNEDGANGRLPFYKIILGVR